MHSFILSRVITGPVWQLVSSEPGSDVKCGRSSLQHLSEVTNYMSRAPPGFIPVCSLAMSQIGRMNLGKDASTFKYYTMYGLQEGFEPFAVNMNREIAMWFSKRLPTFFNVPEDHMDIEVMKYYDYCVEEVLWLLKPCGNSIIWPQHISWPLA